MSRDWASSSDTAVLEALPLQVKLKTLHSMMLHFELPIDQTAFMTHPQEECCDHEAKTDAESPGFHEVPRLEDHGRNVREDPQTHSSHRDPIREGHRSL